MSEGLARLVIAIKGAGEMASAIAWRLHRSGFKRIYLMELPRPLAVRRRVAFSEAIYQGHQRVEGIVAEQVDEVGQLEKVWSRGMMGVLVDPRWASLAVRPAEVVVDAILAKRNMGTRLADGRLVIALGPGFEAGLDAHVVVGTNRGHNLGRLYTVGGDEPNTGVAGSILGRTHERVLRAPADGFFSTSVDIGSGVRLGQVVGTIGDAMLCAGTDGVLRGLLRSGTPVETGLKVGDIDPRGQISYCNTISDKSRAIAGSVLEAILHEFN